MILSALRMFVTQIIAMLMKTDVHIMKMMIAAMITLTVLRISVVHPAQMLTKMAAWSPVWMTSAMMVILALEIRAEQVDARMNMFTPLVTILSLAQWMSAVQVMILTRTDAFTQEITQDAMMISLVPWMSVPRVVTQLTKMAAPTHQIMKAATMA